uniref:YY1 associated factor 2 n=1 Tax=Ursus americanus TaxID=9643 RepID=A0A452RQE6_URSAM
HGDKKSPQVTAPKRQPKPSSDEGYWDCSVCTFRNSAEAFKCMMCDVRKGEKLEKNHDVFVMVEEEQKKKLDHLPVTGVLLLGNLHRSTFFEVIVNASRTKEPLKFPISGSSSGCPS